MNDAPGGHDVEVEVEVRVQPRASRDRIAGFQGGALRVHVAAPPERGKANARLLKLVTDRLGIAKQRVRIVHGETSRTKRLRIAGMSEAEFRARILRATRS